jgi:hypothetical protein
LDGKAPVKGRQAAGSYQTYDQAQEAVDHLSDAKFPVEDVAIVGYDVRLVEQVTERMTNGKATLYGAGIGSMWGLLFGLLVGLFTTEAVWAGLVLGGLVIGAVFGALFGFFAHSVTDGRRDFESSWGLVAGRYDVIVAAEQLERARTLLSKN